MVEKIIKYAWAAGIAVFIVAVSSFGWRSSRPYEGSGDEEAAQRLKGDVRVLSAAIGVRDIFRGDALNRARDHITGVLVENGYRVDYQVYEVAGKEVTNIFAIKEGRDEAKKPVIVGAHYDSCGNPGADDNASAVAVLLELARRLAQTPLERGARFAFFVNEEPPFFRTNSMGSRVYTRYLKEQKEEIYGAVILESVGYYSQKPFSQKYPPLLGFFFPNKGNFLAVVGNIRSRQLAFDTGRALRKDKLPARTLVLDYFPAASFSDHWSFWQEGYRGVMITDTAFLRNPHYHQPTDTLEKLDYDMMAGLAACLASWLTEM